MLISQRLTKRETDILKQSIPRCRWGLTVYQSMWWVDEMVLQCLLWFWKQSLVIFCFFFLSIFVNSSVFYLIWPLSMPHPKPSRAAVQPKSPSLLSSCHRMSHYFSAAKKVLAVLRRIVASSCTSHTASTSTFNLPAPWRAMERAVEYRFRFGHTASRSTFSKAFRSHSQVKYEVRYGVLRTTYTYIAVLYTHDFNPGL